MPGTKSGRVDGHCADPRLFVTADADEGLVQTLDEKIMRVNRGIASAGPDWPNHSPDTRRLLPRCARRTMAP